jgi:thiazole/oxazole-forming peptide maturase SagC family component
VEQKGKPRIKSGYIVVVPNPNEAHIRLGIWGPVVVVTDDKKLGRIAKIIRLLDGNHDVKEIIRAVGRDSEAEIQDLLRNLRNYGVLEEVISQPIAQLPPEEIKRYQPLISYFALAPTPQTEKEYTLGVTAESTVIALKSAKILLIGARMLGSRVALQLAQMGIGNIAIVDDKKLSKEDKAFIPFLSEQSLGSSRARFLQELIKEVNPYVKTNIVKEDCFEDLMQDFDLIIVAKDRPSPTLYKKINEKALKKKFKWTIVTMDGIEGIVGPTFVPHETACYECYELRLECNIESYTEYLQFRKYLDEHPDEFGETIGIPAFADIIAGFLVSDVPFILQGCGTTLGKVLCINFALQKVEANDVLKLPRCPACGKVSRGKPTYQLYRELSSVVEEVKCKKKGSQ